MRQSLRRLCCLFLATALLLTAGCTPSRSSTSAPDTGYTRYTTQFYDTFDTIIQIIGYTKTQQEFEDYAETIHQRFAHLSRLYDRFYEYTGVNNICTINQNAGVAPVAVEPELIDMLQFAKDWCQRTGGRVDITMGPALQLWHQYRERYSGTALPADAPDAVPPMEDLRAAAASAGLDKLVIDPQAGTVFLEDRGMALDVGAVAKGYAVEQVCRTAPAGLLVSVGGNVRAIGPKAGGEPWVVGVQEPDGKKQDYLHTLYLSDQSVVSSGDYQRYYTVDGKRYHHIIDPDTLRPGARWRAVTVVCPDSGLADGLSTALFLLSQVAGSELARQCGAQALWVAPDGTLSYTDGFLEAVRT